MAFVKVVQEQQQSITIQCVSFRAMLGLFQLDRHQGNVSVMEPGVAKILFAKVKKKKKKITCHRSDVCTRGHDYLQ